MLRAGQPKAEKGVLVGWLSRMGPRWVRRVPMHGDSLYEVSGPNQGEKGNR